MPDHIGEANISVQLENNIVSWLNHCFLEMGGFVNIPTGTAGYYGGDLSRLYPVDDPNFADYQVWQAFRKDWVYESGGAISYPSGDPIVCSGIYVGSTFYPASTTTGAYAHDIRFPRGAIVFTNSGAIGSGAISSSTVIRAAFSYKLIQVSKTDREAFNTIQYYSLRNDNSHFIQFGSGSWDIDWQNRMQLPAIMVQLSPRKTATPYELGTLAAWTKQNVSFHVFAEDAYWCRQLADILFTQHDRTIYMYDVNRVENSGTYPLDVFGRLRSGGKLYPDLVEESGLGGYRYKRMWFKDMTVSDMKMPHNNLHGAVVKTNVEYIT